MPSSTVSAGLLERDAMRAGPLHPSRRIARWLIGQVKFAPRGPQHLGCPGRGQDRELERSRGRSGLAGSSAP